MVLCLLQKVLTSIKVPMHPKQETSPSTLSPLTSIITHTHCSHKLQWRDTLHIHMYVGFTGEIAYQMAYELTVLALPVRGRVHPCQWRVHFHHTPLGRRCTPSCVHGPSGKRSVRWGVKWNVKQTQCTHSTCTTQHTCVAVERVLCYRGNKSGVI